MHIAQEQWKVALQMEYFFANYTFVHILTPLGYAGPTMVRGPLGPNGRPGPLKGSDMPSALDEILNKIIKSPKLKFALMCAF